jgi:hypothetical protein
VGREFTLPAFERAFGSIGYKKSKNECLESNIEKVAIFATRLSKGAAMVTHAARQIESGCWTSKVGVRGFTITHRLASLEGDFHGRVVLILSRSKLS